MRITEVRVRLIKNRDDRLKAFCSMTLDDEFVVRDIKVIAGVAGYFVAMPSRKLSDHCGQCGGKNHLEAKFCNGCGSPLPANRTRKDSRGKTRLHTDIAHPINGRCRQRIQETVVVAFQRELEKSRQSGYQPVELDEPDDDIPEAPA
jgi:stage V sporulation protein G